MADTRQRLPRSVRFFARLVSFDLECPHCGWVYMIRMTMKASAGRHGAKSRAALPYDWTTSRFTCLQGCRRIYVMGILAWPVGQALSASATPRDQSPNARQLSALRKEGSGWWLPDDSKITLAIPNETNITTESDRRGSAERYAEDVDEDQG